MQHRHLISSTGLSCAAIDDIIARGSRSDWSSLAAAAKNDSTIVAKIIRVCRPKTADPYEQRYHLWKHHAELALA